MISTRRLISLPAYVVSISKGTYKDGGADPDYSLKNKKIDSDDYTEPSHQWSDEELGLYIPPELL